jgi:hypothetical protein
MTSDASSLAIQSGSNTDVESPPCQPTKKTQRKKAKTKITTHVVRRSVNPVLGLFFGLSTSRMFRRKCEELIQDARIRNCGPAFVLVSALRVVPDGVLDAEFVRTEDLQSSNIVEHISPRDCST